MQGCHSFGSAKWGTAEGSAALISECALFALHKCQCQARLLCQFACVCVCMSVHVAVTLCVLAVTKHARVSDCSTRL